MYEVSYMKPDKKKKPTGLADLMSDEIELMEEMLDEDMFFDPDEEMSDDWKKALKDLKDFGFMEDDE